MKSQVTAYYDRCRRDYEWLWGTSRHGFMHSGFYDDDHPTHRAAVENQVRRVVDRTDAGPGDRVLDAGCGRGGPAVWVADRRGAEVVGVDLNERHLEAARGRARRRGVADATDFVATDFTDLSLRADSVDAVYFIESCCYAPEPRAALTEVRRVLRPGGRLVVADAFLTGADTTRRDRELLDAWLDGWAVPGLSPTAEYRATLEDIGFEAVGVAELTDHVRPSSRRLYRLGMVGWPTSWALERLGLRSPEGTGNARAAYCQHRCLQRGLVEYAHVSARMP